MEQSGEEEKALHQPKKRNVNTASTTIEGGQQNWMGKAGKNEHLSTKEKKNDKPTIQGKQTSENGDKRSLRTKEGSQKVTTITAKQNNGGGRGTIPLTWRKDEKNKRQYLVESGLGT